MQSNAKKNPAKKQKTEDTGVIIVKNNTFQWHRDSVFENYDLKLVACENKKDKCKNPWSLLNDDETTLVNSLKPKFSAPLQLSCILKKQVLKRILGQLRLKNIGYQKNIYYLCLP